MPDTEKEALCARIDELCAEVERLRQERREYQATIDSLVDKCTDHKAENAELRELVDYMTPIAWYGASEQERNHMRELGVTNG